MSVVEVARIELATPNGLQLYDIIRYNYTTKIANGTVFLYILAKLICVLSELHHEHNSPPKKINL